MTRALALAWLGVIAAVALLADCVASARPLAYRRDGDLVVAPNLRATGPAGDALRATLGPDDWALWPPIAADPIDVRTGGALRPLAAPDPAHRLGTDERGRDVAARLVHGTRTTLVTAALAAAFARALALAAGLIAARAGGAVEASITATADVLATTPAVLGAIAVQGLTGARGLSAVVLLVAIPRGADTARLLIARLRAALAEPYVDAARAVGASPARVLLRHALPHATSTLAAATAITAATAVLAEAALTFLGLGAQPPAPSWGDLLAQASQHDLRWWLSIPAGIAVTFTASALLRIGR